MRRTVVVTGGATGIGRAVARRFAADGAEVVITGRRADVLATAAGELGVRGVVCDAADPADVTRSLAELPERVDVLVNNAGGNTDLGRAEPCGLADVAADWQANISANVLTAVLTTTALTDRLADGGAVVLLGSIAAERGSGGGSYGAVKAALATWNVDLSAALGARGVTSNVVAPGFVDETEFFRGRMTDERRGTLRSQTRTGRTATVDEIADAVFFLASPGARAISGQVLHVNGGAVTTR